MGASRLMARRAFDVAAGHALSTFASDGTRVSYVPESQSIVRYGPGLFECSECTMFAHGTSSIVFDLVS